jgi:protein transport protein SEC61 subunit alpha
MRFNTSDFIKLIGAWEGDKITGGLLWFISPPYNLEDALTYPHRTLLYTIFVCFLCALFAKYLTFYLDSGLLLAKLPPRTMLK